MLFFFFSFLFNLLISCFPSSCPVPSHVLLDIICFFMGLPYGSCGHLFRWIKSNRSWFYTFFSPYDILNIGLAVLLFLDATGVRVREKRRDQTEKRAAVGRKHSSKDSCETWPWFSLFVLKSSAPSLPYSARYLYANLPAHVDSARCHTSHYSFELQGWPGKMGQEGEGGQGRNAGLGYKDGCKESLVVAGYSRRLCAMLTKPFPYRNWRTMMCGCSFRYMQPDA